MKTGACCALVSCVSVWFLALGACDDGETAAPPDGGDVAQGDVDGGEPDSANGVDDADTGGAPYSIVVTAPSDDPLEGVHIAVERQTGREEMDTDANGRFDLTLGLDEIVVVTYALEGYVVFTDYDVSAETLEADGVGALEDPLVVVLQPLVTEPAPRSTVLLTQEGGPTEGAVWCTSVNPFSILCNDASRSIPFPARQSDSPVRITATFETESEQHDFAETELPSITEDTAVTMTFDLDNPDPFVLFENVRVNLPTDEESLFQTGDPRPNCFQWEPETFRNRGSTGGRYVESDHSFLEVSCDYFPADGQEALSQIQVGLGADVNGQSNIFLPQVVDPMTIYEALDVPRLVNAPRALADFIRWAPVPNAVAYALQFYTENPFGSPYGAVGIRWSVRTRSTTSLRLPSLPSRYDATVDWPQEDQSGYFALFASDAPNPDASMGDRFAIARRVSVIWDQNVDLVLP